MIGDFKTKTNAHTIVAITIISVDIGCQRITGSQRVNTSRRGKIMWQKSASTDRTETETETKAKTAKVNKRQQKRKQKQQKTMQGKKKKRSGCCTARNLDPGMAICSLSTPYREKRTTQESPNGGAIEPQWP